MGRPEPAPSRPRPRRRGAAAIALAVVAVATIVLVVAPSASSTARSFASGLVGGGGATTSEDDGALPAGATVFDTEHPGITRLDAELLEAVRRAASEAAADGVTFSVNS